MKAKLNNLGFNLGQLILSRRLKKTGRDRRVINLDEAESIVIIYDVVNEKRFAEVRTLQQQLNTNKRKVMVIGYIDSKTIPNYCVEANAGYFFNRRSVNWFGLPKADYLNQFVMKSFDILVDLTTEGHFITKYLTGLSISKFKSGKYSEAKKLYLDLMIECDPDASFADFIRQTLHYLKIIKSK